MKYRLFGQTGLRVSELLLGTMVFQDRAEASRIVGTYADAGGNVLDTASAYGDSETILGDILADTDTNRDRFVLATKYTLSRDAADPNGAGNHRKNLRLSLERSLQRLRTDHVDIFWVHIWDRHTPVEETMRALDDAVSAGKILYVGISDAPAWVVAHANTLAHLRGWTPFAGIQVPYNLLKRDIERELLPMAETFGLSVAAWAPLAAGKLVGGSRVQPDAHELPAIEALKTIAAELGATPAQVALAWTRAKSPTVLPIIGISSATQLTDNLGALDLELPPEAIAELDTATNFEIGFPGDFIAQCEPSAFVFGDNATKVGPRLPRLS
ncbi:aldo/keto reductase [Saccharothrix sp.]|uniref:aldo/keto reductase n=1 Tax=Saccharothrix sp. TaxID=1873460 RepID=UPI00281198EB|nr:aldo/keto reductase [Saccharothrix sp.]